MTKRLHGDELNARTLIPELRNETDSANWIAVDDAATRLIGTSGP